LKGWLQSFPDTKEDKERAVIRFYANKKNHQGLTWQPYLKDAKGALLAWNDPAIWEATVAKGRTPPPSPRKKNGQAAPEKEKPKKEKPKKEEPKKEEPKKEKLKKEKTKAKADTSSSQQAPKQSQKTNNTVPERKPSPYSGKPSTQERSSWLQSSQGPVPEKSKNSYAAMPDRARSSSALVVLSVGRRLTHPQRRRNAVLSLNVARSLRTMMCT
jgi:outer membrane biosynthesis protein TonB